MARYGMLFRVDALLKGLRESLPEYADNDEKEAPHDE
jgi:hypothetical protein